MAKPTYRDATLMLQLAQWQATLNVQEALNWMWSDQYVADFEEFIKKYPWGSEESGRAGNPRLYENFEALAAAEVAYNARLAKRSRATKRAKT